MAKENLTAKTINAMDHPECGQRLVWDAKLSGFGLRITATAKSFIAQARVEGRTRRVTIGSASVFHVEDARKEARKVLGAMAGDVDPNRAKAEARTRTITLTEALTRYLSGRSLKPGTAANVRTVMNATYGDWMNKELRSITPQMVVDRFRKRASASESGANLSARYLRSVWNYARADTANADGSYILPEAPTKRLSDLKVMAKPKRRQHYLTSDRFPAFFDALGDTAGRETSNRHPEASRNFAAFMELVLRTGLRKNEASTLRWDQVSFAARTMTIPPEQAKNGNELVLPMSAQTEALLEALRERTDGREYVWGDQPLDDPRKSLARFRKAIGDDALGCHDLRRTFAVLAERLDVSHSKIKRMMNHSDGGDVTMGYLVSTDPERLREPVQRISDEIDRLRSAIICKVES